MSTYNVELETELGAELVVVNASDEGAAVILAVRKTRQRPGGSTCISSVYSVEEV